MTKARSLVAALMDRALSLFNVGQYAVVGVPKFNGASTEGGETWEMRAARYCNRPLVNLD